MRGRKLAVETPDELAMIPKYLVSLAAAVLLISIACTRLSFATHALVLSGTSVEEVWPFEFTLQADSTHTYKIDPQIQEAVEKGIVFVAQGPVQVDSAKVDIAPQDVISKVGYESITSSGGGGYAHVKWEAPADSANGAHGDIRMGFPTLPGLGEPNLRFGTYTVKDDQGRWILREVTTYRSAASVFLARWRLTLALGLPCGILLQSAFWAFVLKKEKRLRIAAFPPEVVQAGRTFYPDPIKEWARWTYVLGFFAVFAGFLAAGSASEGYMDSRTYWLVLLVQGAGVIAGLAVVYLTRSALLTVRVDADGISYFRGRSALPWTSERWPDVLKVRRRTWKYAGKPWERLEVEFTDLNKKKLIIPQDMVGYPGLRDFLLSNSVPGKST